MRLGNAAWGIGLRVAAIATTAIGVAALTPACSSNDSGGSGGFGATAAAAGAGAMGGVGATGGVGGATGGTGATGGSGAVAGTGGSSGCPNGLDNCGGVCTNTQFDPGNCGACGTACQTGEFCSQGTCAGQCLGSTLCNGACVNTDTDPNNCGACGNICPSGQVCSVGVCGVQCTGGATKCGDTCTDTQTDPKNCGACGTACPGTYVCSAGTCAVSCAPGTTKCGNSCVDTSNDKNNCGTCGNVCPGGQHCINGSCSTCDAVNQDCDGDGWAGSTEGDCCEIPGICGSNPVLVNPGALEVEGNGIDDNCNGLIDLFDQSDTLSCDVGLTSNSNTATDYAKALGICRTTQDSPASKKDKTWGLIEAKLIKADGTPLQDNTAKSIRGKFGTNILPQEGSSLAVIASGTASDGVQTNPGPATPETGVSHSPNSVANISTCTDPLCIKDWYTASNPPLKGANQFPQAAGCGTPSGGDANDSVCIYLKVRAPTNARAFSFNSYFFSAEYPEWVCTSYNDQYVAVVDTPTGPTAPIPNPMDKNLMTFVDPATQTKWPIGVNVAGPGPTGGTDLFAVCDPAVTNAGSSCYDSSVNNKSCSLGLSGLAGTGFEADSSGCVQGAGTFWRTTSGNVNPGEIVTLRICIFDVSDHSWDSLAVIDGFKWLANATLPGTG